MRTRNSTDTTIARPCSQRRRPRSPGRSSPRAACGDARRHRGARSRQATKPIVFATGSGTIPSGRAGKIALKLTKAGRAGLSKKGKLTALVVTAVTRGPAVTKVTNRVVFKAAKHRR